MSSLKYKIKTKILDPDLVKNEKDFINFLKDLHKEKVKDDNDIKKDKKYEYTSSGNYGWENGTISGFLEAMIAGYEDSRIEDKEYDNIWTKIANIVYLGKIYE